MIKLGGLLSNELQQEVVCSILEHTTWEALPLTRATCRHGVPG